MTWKDVATPVRRGWVFLEKVRQEMPNAHLELLHSGSLCVTTEALGAVLCSACLAVHSLLFLKAVTAQREENHRWV